MLVTVLTARIENSDLAHPWSRGGVWACLSRMYQALLFLHGGTYSFGGGGEGWVGGWGRLGSCGGVVGGMRGRSVVGM